MQPHGTFATRNVGALSDGMLDVNGYFTTDAFLAVHGHLNTFRAKELNIHFQGKDKGNRKEI